MTYRYAEEIGFLENCPPADAVPCDMEAYRFVHENIADDRNFKCVSKLNPSRKLKPEQRCSGLALSLFVTREKALKRYKELKSTNQNIGKTLGNNLAVGIIKPDDGCMSHPGNNGHFDFWEAESADFIASFHIVEDLVG